MTEARIGRLLAASLRQAIGECLPFRLDFYEHWLKSEGLHDGSIGLAPFTAVAGFLRTEGGSYEAVVARAGELAAEWSVASLSPMRRRAIAWLPRPLRVRAALRVAAATVRKVHPLSRTSARVTRTVARIEIRSSLFCAVRERPSAPLCGFYLALETTTLRLFGIPVSGRLESCRAMTGSSCVLVLDLGATAVVEPAMAA